MSTTESLTIENALEYVKSISDGNHDTVRPGMPLTFSEACVSGDTIWQGDLGICIVDDGPPSDYIHLENVHQCLVPGGTTIGARHCLDRCDCVEMWIPERWDETSLNGPYLHLTNGITITHPVHGNVTIPACFTKIQIMYQREWDAELARERRARD
jgi:hypothetical protein